MPFASTARLCAALALLLAAGCAQPQRPYTFTVPQGSEAPIDTLLRTLTSEGHQPASVLRELGIVHTRWVHRGSHCSAPQNSRGALMRRLTVSVAPTGPDNTVTVRAEVQCCTSPQMSPDGSTLRGPCEAMSKIYDQQQREVETLGSALRRAMARPAQ